MHVTTNKIPLVQHYLNLLDDFYINPDIDIVDKLSRLYPNDIAMENYVRELIKESLNK